ncbi:transcript variant X3 [Nothobranchius furzeri]|uniref:Lysosomal-associated membrane protein 2 n=1 Tax=Nothobranchius furzeri TaxID=105023 RepID=A0A8C6K9W7_NOTFU|nr:transcript variant X3 [Nothobranchius furzeri]
MSRFVAFVLLFSFGVVIHLSHGVEVNVTKEGKLCLYANLMLNFSVSYEVAGNKNQTVVIELPANATSNSSTCDEKSPTLTLDFGAGNSWSVSFTSDMKSYHVDTVTFTYNLSDSTFFKNALSNDTVTVSPKTNFNPVPLNTSYSCNSEYQITAPQVNMTLWKVLLQAFITNGNRSENYTSCPADAPTPTPTPSVTNTTTPAPVTNTTTPAPVTNTTTPAPVTTTPTPTLPTPFTGNYTLKSNETVCLLANFGLRISLKIKEKYQEMNFEPVGAEVSGSCGTNISELVLGSDQMNITFTFNNDTKKFLLHDLSINVKTSSGVFNASSTNLTLWEASIGSSYMCNKEQNFTISDQLSLFTFNLHVQPFGVKKGVFSTAHECSLDDPSILIPIIVGAALAGLIIIVVIAYVIGRRKTYAGYQTL